MKKCCIFDLDGTLLNTIDTIAYYGNNALNKHGFSSIDTEKYKYFVGSGAKNLILRMLSHLGVEDKEVFDKIYGDYMKAYDADVLYLTHIYDGIEKMLGELKAKGIKLAVLSNKPDFAARSAVEMFFGKDYFDVVFGQRENVAIKPDPAGVFEILNILDVEKDDCLYIGDTAVDMKTGKSAGLYTVGVLWGFREKEELEGANADSIIERPEELLKFL